MPGVRPALLAAMAMGKAGLDAVRPQVNHPLLVVCATTREAEEMVAALRCYLPDEAVDMLPAWETLPHERLSPRADTVAARLAVLRRLAHSEEGAIGVLVANAAVALGMNVIGYDPMISVEHAWKLAQGVRHENSLDELFAACDFITVHVPMTDKTRGMIGRRALSLCKKGVRIINYARGGLVDEAALLEALADGRVAAYVTDFPSDALLGAKGVICTPHLGASTPESEENCAVMAAAQTRDFLESGIIRNSVNLPAVDVAPVSKPRLFCIHENVPNVLGSITSAVAGFGLNISDLVNRSRGNIAVSVVDLDEAPSEKREALTQAVKNIAGMKRVRLLGV